MVLQALDLLVPVLQVLVGVLGPFLDLLDDLLDLLRQGGPDGVLRQRFLRPRRQGDGQERAPGSTSSANQRHTGERRSYETETEGFG